MIYNDKKFDLMVESAWRAFESTLMLHGMHKHEVEHFTDYLDVKDGYKAVADALIESVEWEDE